MGYGSDRSAKYPDGRPIEALIIADPEYEASRPYALIQSEHDNELTATLAQKLMARVACENPDLLDDMGYNLIFLNTACADGLALQRWVEEGGGQFDPVAFALWGYRPTGAEQLAWGYPFKYKTVQFDNPPGEVRASMDIMERYKPDCLLALHSSGIDDVYHFLSHPYRSLTKQLARAAKLNGLFMQQGEPEVPYLRYDHKEPGIYWPLPTAETEYEHTLTFLPPEKIIASDGTTSAGYLSGIVENPLMALSEMPYLSAAITQDRNPSGYTTRQATAESAIAERQILKDTTYYFEKLKSRVDHSNDPSVGRLARSVAWWCYDVGPRLIKELEAPPLMGNYPLSNAQRYSQVQRFDYCHTSFFLGGTHHLAQLLGARAMAGAIRDAVEQRIMNIDLVSPIKVNPTSRLVGAQALSGFAVIRHGRSDRPQPEKTILL